VAPTEAAATPVPWLRDALAAELRDSDEAFEVASVALRRHPSGVEVWIIVEGGRPGKRRRWQVPLEYGPDFDAWVAEPESAREPRATYLIAVHLEEWWHVGSRGRATRLPLLSGARPE
jgi:hypothetical protein